ncbi:hypothetical protein OUZ56_012223 [Daphnia magna]|uniref:Retrotransposon gag domain-containing protein n=1 Tax=Daphnia magna TaxID=35525 RepID=A0ABQ9Z2D9_9CRUS|nr:hypothetical protein OUZ56_012223 [Daphnia magna]
MYFTEFENCIRNSGESIRDYACRLKKLYSFAYPTEVGKTIDADVLKLRETLLMDDFLGRLKPNLRERMSFKDYRNLNDLVKATEKCAAILNEAKLEKRSVEFFNTVSANANAQEFRETKNEILELKSVIEQLSQKMKATQLADKSHESINAVATGHNAQLAESKQEIEELKNLLTASNKSYSDMMKRSRDSEKMMRNLQLQVAGMSQAIPQAQPMRQYKQSHSGLVADNSARFPHQPPVHRTQQLTTLTRVGGDQTGQPASNAIKVGTLRVIAHPHHFVPTPDMRRQLRILVSSTPGIRKTRSHQF